MVEELATTSTVDPSNMLIIGSSQGREGRTILPCSRKNKLQTDILVTQGMIANGNSFPANFNNEEGQTRRRVIGWYCDRRPDAKQLQKVINLNEGKSLQNVMRSQVDAFLVGCNRGAHALIRSGRLTWSSFERLIPADIERDSDTIVDSEDMVSEFLRSSDYVLIDDENNQRNVKRSKYFISAKALILLFKFYKHNENRSRRKENKGSSVSIREFNSLWRLAKASIVEAGDVEGIETKHLKLIKKSEQQFIAYKVGWPFAKNVQLSLPFIGENPITSKRDPYTVLIQGIAINWEKLQNIRRYYKPSEDGTGSSPPDEVVEEFFGIRDLEEMMEHCENNSRYFHKLNNESGVHRTYRIFNKLCPTTNGMITDHFGAEDVEAKERIRTKCPYSDVPKTNHTSTTFLSKLDELVIRRFDDFFNRDLLKTRERDAVRKDHVGIGQYIRFELYGLVERMRVKINRNKDNISLQYKEDYEIYRYAYEKYKNHVVCRWSMNV